MNLIGLRTIKTAIAVTLSILVARLFNFEYPFFVAMTALISMDKTMGDSFKTGRNRIMGTLFGALIGISLSYIDRGNAFLCGLGMIILIELCNIFNLKGSITIGGIVMIAIMVHTEKTPIFYGFHRTLDTLIGASLSFVVNATVFPYSTVKRLDRIAIGLWDETEKCVMDLRNHKCVNTEEIEDKLTAIEGELNLYNHEFLFRNKKQYVNELTEHYKMAKRLLLELKVANTIDSTVANDVYEYHIEKAIEIYNSYIKQQVIESNIQEIK